MKLIKELKYKIRQYLIMFANYNYDEDLSQSDVHRIHSK